MMFKKELGIDEQLIGRDGGWTDNQMISKVYGRHITPTLQSKQTNYFKGSRSKMHEVFTKNLRILQSDGGLLKTQTLSNPLNQGALRIIKEYYQKGLTFWYNNVCRVYER